ncbi:MAG: flagellar basal-body rod protein FlgC [Myxococcota bacterium]|jgi:flagellar basal-body rod protein FlgC
MMKGFAILSSGMSAQRVRLNTVSSNLANAQTTRTEDGGPYKRQRPIFEPVPIAGDAHAAGVRVTDIVKDETPGMVLHDPDHPDADADGLVHMPNVNVVEEMVDMMTASRSFEANAQAFQTLREMVQQALSIGR